MYKILLCLAFLCLISFTWSAEVKATAVEDSDWYLVSEEGILNNEEADVGDDNSDEFVWPAADGGEFFGVADPFLALN